MLTGNFMSAQEALQLGFASRLVARDKLLETALSLQNMNSKNPWAFASPKSDQRQSRCNGLEQALQLEDRNQILLLQERCSTKREEGKYF